MGVEIGELPSWRPMRGFTPKGLAGAFPSGYYQDYQYVDVMEGRLQGLLWCWRLLCCSATALLIRNSSRSCDARPTAEDSQWTRIPDYHLCPAPLNPFIVIDT